MSEKPIKRRRISFASQVRAADPTYKQYRPYVYTFSKRLFKDPKKQPYET